MTKNSPRITRKARTAICLGLTSLPQQIFHQLGHEVPIPGEQKQNPTVLGQSWSLNVLRLSGDGGEADGVR